ncbi:MAG: hypothetical protein A3K19_11390 [Lentisphaerae bacterium RIFOXYB12_FULL_65_16]|nr:MAG: hypothetical protein A3K18_09780 [Lentisphaerae bacterium RIFOXYA12_64_32]OGV90181.1 MAG: hypothetical protein A3K19_11390 [Lentisphaerae bacterium RIFOXYB12_FULL_65_16]
MAGGPPRPPNRRRAPARFTLIELLVVITIIAILASMLLPALANAKEKGREAVCSGNLKQVAMGFFSYVEDSDEDFPRNTVYNPGTGVWEDWPYYAVKPHFGSTDIMTCPTSTRLYGYSQYVGRNWASGSYKCARYSTIAKPSNTVLVMDALFRCVLPSSRRRPNGAPFAAVGTDYTAWLCPYQFVPAAPHHGGGGFVFVDGHKARLTAKPDYQAYEGGPNDIWLTGNK